MACGATLKRSVEFDALLGPQSGSPKRRRCSTLAGPGAGAGAAAPHRHLRSDSAAFGGEISAAPRLTPEQIFQNIKQEYNRFQWRRQLEGNFHQTDSNNCADGPSSSMLLNTPSSPGTSSSKKDQPLFTLRQVGIICERLLKDHESKLREEYEQVLNTKLAEQYDAFVKFTHDQIMRRYGERPASYVS